MTPIKAYCTFCYTVLKVLLVVLLMKEASDGKLDNLDIFVR